MSQCECGWASECMCTVDCACCLCYLHAGLRHTAYAYNTPFVKSAYFAVINVPNGRMTHPRLHEMY